MKKKENVPIAYEILKKDYIMVNSLAGVLVLGTFIYMLLERWDIVPNMICIVHDMFHVYCLGCGGTRAIFALLEGNIVESLYCNPAVVLGALLVLYYEIGVLITLWKRNGKRYYCTNVIPVVVYVIIVFVFSVVRNYLLIACGIDMLEDFLI